ncbi:hypothetical protein B7463_g4728, partial [Scytalidium lignicola]
MSRMAFAFGEGNSYFYDGPLCWDRFNVLQEVENLFQGLHTVIDLYSITFSPNGSFYIGYIHNNLNVKYVDGCLHANLPKELQTWLGEKDKHKEYDPHLGRVVEKSSIARDIATMRVWLGPNNSFYAQDKTGYTLGNLPENATRIIESYRKKGDYVKNLALGYGSSYFVIFQSGLCCYDLSGCSKQLDKFMDKRPRSQTYFIEDFEYISVSPFEPNRYIVFFKDGTYYCSFPQSWQQRCSQISKSNSEFLRSQHTNIVRLPRAQEKYFASILAESSVEAEAGGMAAISLDQSQSTTAASTHAASSTFHTNTNVDASGHIPTVANPVSTFHAGTWADTTNLDTVSYATTGGSYGGYSDGGSASFGGDGGGAIGGF